MVIEHRINYYSSGVLFTRIRVLSRFFGIVDLIDNSLLEKTFSSKFN